MIKYYAFYDNQLQKMRINILNETALNNRSRWEKERNEYNSVPIFDTLEECIKSLGSYTKYVLLFDGKEVIPDAINFPRMESYYILKPVRFPVLGC